MTLETIKTHTCFGGVQGYYRHHSECCDGPMEFSVFLPPGATGGEGRPVLYFLSGLTCTAENFTSKAGAQRVAAELGLIVVAPDTSPRGKNLPGEDDDWDFGSGAGFYVDATQTPWASCYRMYSYVADELPALIDVHFPTRGASFRGVCGHSMGGHGALVVALREPDGWRSVSALAPIVAPTQVPWGQKAFAGYLGDNRATWEEYDATCLVRHKQHPTSILIDQGADDAFLKEQLEPDRFVAAAKQAGQALDLRLQPGYDHGYFFVASFIADHLRHHAILLG